MVIHLDEYSHEFLRINWLNQRVTYAFNWRIGGRNTTDSDRIVLLGTCLSWSGRRASQKSQNQENTSIGLVQKRGACQNDRLKHKVWTKKWGLGQCNPR